MILYLYDMIEVLIVIMILDFIKRILLNIEVVFFFVFFFCVVVMRYFYF